MPSHSTSGAQSSLTLFEVGGIVQHAVFGSGVQPPAFAATAWSCCIIVSSPPAVDTHSFCRPGSMVQSPVIKPEDTQETASRKPSSSYARLSAVAKTMHNPCGVEGRTCSRPHRSSSFYFGIMTWPIFFIAYIHGNDSFMRKVLT